MAVVMLSVIMVSVIMVSVIMVSVIMVSVIIMRVVKLSVIFVIVMLNIVTWSVAMQSVVAPYVRWVTPTQNFRQVASWVVVYNKLGCFGIDVACVLRSKTSWSTFEK